LEGLNPTLYYEDTLPAHRPIPSHQHLASARCYNRPEYFQRFQPFPAGSVFWRYRLNRRLPITGLSITDYLFIDYQFPATNCANFKPSPANSTHLHQKLYLLKTSTVI